MENEIKATELRVGNHVHDRSGNLCIVDEITLDKDKPHGYDFLATVVDGTLTELPFKPIPITEERLLEFGFVEERVSSFGGQDEWTGLRAWSINGNNWIFRGNPECLILSGYINTQIKYVHQLQNLYFALTNQELTKKDK